VRYKIEPEVLTRVCAKVVDLPLETGERFDALIEKLSEVYPISSTTTGDAGS
jgi:hypothetical protein